MIKEIAEVIRGFLEEKKIPTEDGFLKIHGQVKFQVLMFPTLEHPTYFDTMPYGVKKKLEEEFYKIVSDYMEERQFYKTIYFENYTSYWGGNQISVYVKDTQAL